MASGSRIENEKFNSQNFELWKIKIEDLIVYQGQWETTYQGTILTCVLREEWEKIKRRERIMTRMCLAYSVLLIVSGEY
jgi:hypothetical protein